MKQHTKNRIKAAVLIGIWGLGKLGLILSCKNEQTPDPDPVCECEDKEHLGVGENCCDIKGCECVQKVYGTVAGIPIYREGNVSAGDMGDAVIVVNIIYEEALVPNQKTSFVDKITEIRIKTTKGMSKNGTILTIGYNEEVSELIKYIEGIANGTIVHVRWFLLPLFYSVPPPPTTPYIA